MEAGPGQWVQRGQAGGPTVLAGHSPPPERLGPQNRLSQAGEFGGGEGRANTTRGRLWARLEGVQGRQAKLGQVWSLAVLAGHFPRHIAHSTDYHRLGTSTVGRRGEARRRDGNLNVCGWKRVQAGG